MAEGSLQIYFIYTGFNTVQFIIKLHCNLNYYNWINLILTFLTSLIGMLLLPLLFLPKLNKCCIPVPCWLKWNKSTDGLKSSCISICTLFSCMYNMYIQHALSPVCQHGFIKQFFLKHLYKACIIWNLGKQYSWPSNN